MNISWEIKEINYLKKSTFLVLFFLLTVKSAYGITGFDIKIPIVSSPYAKLEGITFNAGWLLDQDLELKANIESIYLPQIDQYLKDVNFECRNASFDGVVFKCPTGKLDLENDLLGHQVVHIAFQYDNQNSKLISNISDLNVFGGAQKISIEAKNNELQAVCNGNINLSTIKTVTDKFLKEFDLQTIEGLINFNTKLFIRNNNYMLDAHLISKDISLENSKSTGVYQAGLESEISINIDKSSITYDIHSVLQKAFIYLTYDISDTEQHFYSFEPLKPISIDVLGDYSINSKSISLDSFIVDQPGILNLDLASQIDVGKDFSVDLIELNLNKFDLAQMVSQVDYPVMPFFERTKLKLSGDIAASIRANKPLSTNPLITSRVELSDLNYSYDDQSIGINGLSGIINWNSDGSASPSTISWYGGNFQLIPFDSSVLNFILGANSLNIDKFKVPTLGGKIIVDSVYIQDLGFNIEKYKYDFGIKVEDISLTNLTSALQWPEMQGVINASFPQVVFENNMIQIGGSAKVNLFNGEMTISNLAIEDPLGIVPRMRGDLEIDKLDLEELSSTLQFGRITGKLTGYAKDIQLEQWFPIGMNMSMYTPDNDDTKRRISQKAVDFISDIGGVGGSLSRTYLRFFEEFSYQKIGINLKLEDGVCIITGIEPKGEGYYIVKGSFIPRIDIVGYESQVSWVDLIEKIKGAIESGAPVTQ